MRKSATWFRMPSDLIDNPSLLAVSDVAALFFVHLLCLKSAGILDEIDNKNCPPETKRQMLALRLRKTESELNQILRELADVDLVDFDNAQPKQWENYAKKTAPKKPRPNKTKPETNTENQSIIKKNLNTTAQPVISFDFRTGQWQNVTPMHIEKWQTLYPQVNIEAELDRMCIWLIEKKQPKSHYFFFIDNWLKRAQNNKSGGQNYYQNYKKGYKKDWQTTKQTPKKQAFNTSESMEQEQYGFDEPPAFLANYKNPLDIPDDIDYGVSGPIY